MKDKYGHKTYKHFTPEEKLKHRERIWKAKIRKEYGITAEQYYEMFTKQNGLCAICNTQITNQKLCVDHSHITGKVRGLLCRNCNLKLQIFDDFEFMKKAQEYIEIHDVEDKEPLR